MQTTFTLPAGFGPGDSVLLVSPDAVPPPPPPPPPPPLPPWDPTNLGAFLVHHRMPDGSPALLPGTGVPQLSTDVMTWRKHDYRSDGLPGGYGASDAVADPRGFWVTTWQYTNYGPFNPADGDGGEAYVYDNGFIRADATRDGGVNRDQFFVGRYYGGDGWTCFDDKTPTGSWKTQLTHLSIASDSSMQPPLGTAFTRWRREILTVRFRIFGVWQDITDLAIIYQHFNGPSVAEAVDMEEAIWLRRFGRIWYASYRQAPAADLGARVPVLPWPAPDDRDDFTLQDARLFTDIIEVAPGEATTIEWPLAGFVV
jgi:hypothetical protein